MAGIIRSYRDLIVWQRAMQLFEHIDAIVDQFPPYRRFWLGGQMHRAALSILCNIADGHGHDFRNVYLRRLADGKSSTTELEAQLIVVSRMKYASAAPTERALAIVSEVGRMLRGLSRSVRDSEVPPRASPARRARKGETGSRG